MKKAYSPVVWLVVLVMAVSLACGTGSTPAATQPPAPPAEKPTDTPEVKQEPPTATVPAVPQGLVTNLQDVKKATIQIESQGTFIDPQVGLVLNGAGRGSGFIIDPSGIAVTNNHVVTGAALLKVWVGGETTPHNAKVLGVSECSDLAVIDIDGDGYPYVKWYEGPIDVGMDIYVAGFPLGDPEYTLTRGVISKAKANGETSWASVDSVIEYDANTNPGNSGGPVINADGNVLGVHYAGSQSTRQAFGISRDIAKGVIDQLRTGKDIDTIGVNGQAVSSEDGSLTGIWVSSVKSGSPADKAGVQGGDIITKMENLVLASDGTMSDYCDILRSHDPSATFNLQVLRFASSQVLEGQLNGRQLAPVVTLDTGTTGTSTGSSTAAGNPDASNSGEEFFSTDFNDAENWYTFSVPKSDNYTTSLDNGVLYIQVPEDQQTVYALYDLDLNNPNMRVDALVETVGGPNTNNISLVCRATQDGWYEFSMGSGGYWYIWKYQNGEYGDPLAQGATTAIHLQKAKNELTATCIGTDLTFYVNGSRVGSTRDRTFQGGGQVGVSVSTLGIPGAEVEFDAFVASVP